MRPSKQLQRNAAYVGGVWEFQRAVSRVRSVGRRFGMFSDRDGAREHGLSERATHSCGTRVSNYVMQ